ncbi:hypothetical protein [Amycolatopsis sp. WGS_07]|uniref:hypothetical protein n=1 Tax=Amycolatopsis sp. WGS_07 TaxID=3076764 RepID=UPI003873B203
MEAPFEHSGTLILRVWAEGEPGAFRARILRTTGAEAAPPLAASTADEVHAAVQAWLDTLLEPDR